MTLLESITRSQSLLQELSANKQCDDNAEISELLSALSTELDTIQRLAGDSTQLQASTSNKPDVKLGCYVFANEKGFFCPNCYDHYDRKVATTKINKKLRVCPVCRTSIK
ncbi:MAG: hypothetical protein PSN44_06435 [Gammaproteobacteria bacterium]|nr:hypothetical protein [Gammaproteobacteria bacterium]